MSSPAARNPIPIPTAGVLTIGSGTKITGNTTGNVYLADDTSLIKLCDDLSGAAVGITTPAVPTAEAPVPFTVNGSDADIKCFNSDQNYGVKYNTDHLELVETPTAMAGAAYSASLTLTESININFKMRNLGNGFSLDNLTISVDGKAIDNDDITYDSTANTVSCVLKEVVPSELGVEWPIVVTYDGVQVKDFDYSVKDYCDAVFAAYAKDNTTYAKLNTLCEALLNYGKYAEDYANSDTASTVNEGHEITFGSGYTFKDLQDSAKKLGSYADKDSTASLALSSTIKLKFTLKNCVNELSTGYTESGEADENNPQNFYILNGSNQQIDPKRVTVTKDGDKTVVSVDLYASQLSTSYTLKLKGVDTSAFCITYGVYNYCSDAQNQTAAGFTDTLKTLCKAIHNYGQAVQDYIKNK